jgi:hypothetical protein
MKNVSLIFKLVIISLLLILTTTCKKDQNNTNNPNTTPNNGGIVIKGQIPKTKSLNATDSVSLSDAKKVIVFSKYYYSITDIVNNSFSVTGQMGSSAALIFLDANNHYIGNLSPENLNVLPLGNLKDGASTQIDLSTLKLVGTSVIPTHDPLGNEIIISPSEINSMKSIGAYYQSIAKNIDADNDGIPDVLSNKQLVVYSIFARYSGRWGINTTPPVPLDSAYTYINYSLAIQGGTGITFSNGDIALSGPADSPYSDISTWGYKISPSPDQGFIATFNRQATAPINAPWGTSFLPLKQGTYTLTLDKTRKYTLDYSNIDVKYNLVLIIPTLHTNSDGKLTSITFEYKLPNGTTVNPASMLTNVMVQCTDVNHTQFYDSPQLTAATGLTTLTPALPVDISALSGIDVWYDDLLGNQYDIIWR